MLGGADSVLGAHWELCPGRACPHWPHRPHHDTHHQVVLGYLATSTYCLLLFLNNPLVGQYLSTETVSAPQSAFALDLQQVSKMLTARTPRTLCLIDEFGKGTMPVDGIALLAACVKHFAATGKLNCCFFRFIAAFSASDFCYSALLHCKRS